MDDGVPRSLRRLAAISWRLLVLIALLVVIGLAVDRLRIIVLPLLAALILATALLPPKRALRRRGWPNGLAALAVVFGGVLVIAGIVAVVAATVVRDFDAIDLDLESGIEEVGDWLVEDLGLPRDQVDSGVDDLVSGLRGNAGTIAGGLYGGVLVFAEVVAGAVLTLVLLIFLVKDAERIQRAMLRRAGPQQRRDILELTSRLINALGGYLRGTVLLAFIDAVLIGIGLLVIGVPFALALAVITFFGAFIPYVGALAAGIAAILIALVSDGVGAAVAVTAVVIVVQQLEGNVLQPVIVGRSVSLHPLVVLVSVAAGGALWGILGAFVAVPVAAVTTSIFDYYTLHRAKQRRFRRPAGQPQASP